MKKLTKSHSFKTLFYSVISIIFVLILLIPMASRVEADTPLTIVNNVLASGTVGISYSQQLFSSGPYQFWSADSALPGGLSLDPTTGAITGTPTSAGTFNTMFTAVSNVSANKTLTIKINNPGTPYAWGRGDFGQLGNGTTPTNALMPVQVSNLNGIVEVSGGYAFNVALKVDGTVWGWGRSAMGELGSGASGPDPIPIQIVGVDEIVNPY